MALRTELLCISFYTEIFGGVDVSLQTFTQEVLFSNLGQYISYPDRFTSLSSIYRGKCRYNQSVTFFPTPLQFITHQTSYQSMLSSLDVDTVVSEPKKNNIFCVLALFASKFMNHVYFAIHISWNLISLKVSVSWFVSFLTWTGELNECQSCLLRSWHLHCGRCGGGGCISNILSFINRNSK
jgi:hypothetical protein